jgi:hypothetical protein
MSHSITIIIIIIIIIIVMRVKYKRTDCTGHVAMVKGRELHVEFLV